MDYSDTFKEGNVTDLMAPKVENLRKGKTLVLIPKANADVAANEAVIGRVLGCETTDQYKYIVIKEHYVYDPTITFQNKKKYVPCLGQGCPLCAAGSKPNERFGFMFEHFNSMNKDPMGMQVNVPKRKILLVGSTVARQLYIKHKIKPLSSQVFMLGAVLGKPITYIIESRGDYTTPVNCDPNDLNDFSVLKPTQRDAEEARRLAQFVNSGANAPQQSFGQPAQNYGAPQQQSYGAAPAQNQNYGTQNYQTQPQQAAPQNYGTAQAQQQAPVNNNYGAAPVQNSNPYSQPAAPQQSQQAPEYNSGIPDPWSNATATASNTDKQDTSSTSQWNNPNVVAGNKLFDPKEASAMPVNYAEDDIPF